MESGLDMMEPFYYANLIHIPTGLKIGLFSGVYVFSPFQAL